MSKEKKQGAVPLPEFLSSRSAQTPSPVPRRSFAAIAIWSGAVVFVIVSYVFCVSGGRFGPWQQRSWGYSLLADGFMRGHTYLTISPPAGLLALRDPYDPAQNSIFPGRDTSLFNGHFYYYFGPIPALLLVLVKMCNDKPTSIIGDQILVFSFMIGLLTAITILILHWRRRLFPQSPAWTVGAAIVAVAMSLPLTWLVANPAMLEAAIAGGQCFMLLGLHFAMIGVQASKPKWADLCVAGMFWAMAWGCRLSLAPAIGIIAILTVFELRGRGSDRRETSEWIRPVIALAGPLIVAALGLLIYNRVRFNSWTQTGWDYQLAWMNHRALAGTGFIVSPRYIPANLYRYLIELPRFSKEFPFLILQQGAHGLVRRFPPPALFALEPTAGILWSTPFCLFALGLFLPARCGTSMPPARLTSPSAASPAFFRWLIRCLLAACVLAMAPVMCGVGSVERYLADGAPAFLLLAVLGAWRLLERVGRHHWLRWIVMGLIPLLALITATLGILLLFGA